jgi:hypothetical protein
VKSVVTLVAIVRFLRKSHCLFVEWGKRRQPDSVDTILPLCTRGQILISDFFHQTFWYCTIRYPVLMRRYQICRFLGNWHYECDCESSSLSWRIFTHMATLFHVAMQQIITRAPPTLFPLWPFRHKSSDYYLGSRPFTILWLN